MIPSSRFEITDDADVLRDQCGVFGVWGCREAAQICYLGLYSLQHRGQESAGIVSADTSNFYVVKDMGLVSEIFDPSKLSHLKGTSAVGHVRYSTTGASLPNNVQPLFTKTSKGKVAVSHNGNLTNAYSIYTRLKSNGALFQTTVDTEVILHLISRSQHTKVMDIFRDVLGQIEGAFSLVFLGEKYLVAARDTHGFRPLVLGRLGEGYVVASETCAFDLIGATYVREIQPGEIVVIDRSGITSGTIRESTRHSFCVFEHVYFARPDSVIFGDPVHLIRKEFGKALARQYPVDADLVMAIPDSGNSAALGYAEQSGIPFEVGMTRNHYVGRTFIQPTQKIRDFAVKVKLNPIRSVLEGKRVVVVDDSLVRGTTSKQRVSAIRQAGAKEVHLRISSPPITHPCHFGIDTPKREKLIAAQKTVEEILKYVGADSIGYLDRDEMLAAVASHAPSDFCTACFDGKYPLKVRDKGKFTLGTRKIKLYAEKN
ncbi:amidophosphoribosyltransferase [bacterium]|nr:amidophosphoribosyltransferase [bacterium]